jgi:hypothetical protein
MENIPRVLEKEIERMTATRGQVKKPRRWQLLVVGERGRVYSIKHFRAALSFLVLVAVASLAAALGLYWYYQKPVAENQRLTAEIASAQTLVEQLRDEKEVLMARLARTTALLASREAESDPDRSEPPPPQETPSDDTGAADPVDPPAAGDDHGAVNAVPDPDTAPPSPDPSPEKEIAPTEAPEPADSGSGTATVARVEEPPGAMADAFEAVAAPPAAPRHEIQAQAAPPQPAADAVEPPPAVVAIDAFQIVKRPDAGQISVRFKIKKIDAGGTPVKGYMFVLVGSAQSPPDQWLVFPDSPLDGKRPANHKKGRYFSIARFNTIRFSPRSVDRTEGLNEATVLVYDEDGELLLEERQTP